MIFNIRKRNTRKEIQPQDDSQETSEPRLRQLLSLVTNYSKIVWEKVKGTPTYIGFHVRKITRYEAFPMIIFIATICCLSIPMILLTSGSKKLGDIVDDPILPTIHSEDIHHDYVMEYYHQQYQYMASITDYQVPLASLPEEFEGDEDVEDLGTVDEEPHLLLGEIEDDESIDEEIPLTDKPGVSSQPTETPSYTLPEFTPPGQMIYYDVPLSRELQEYLTLKCRENGVPVPLALALIKHESNFNPRAISSHPDYGLFQIWTGNHGWIRRALGLPSDASFLDPYVNIQGGTYILGMLIAEHGDLHKALMSYNGGDNYLRGNLNRGIYSTDYSRRIVRDMEIYAASGSEPVDMPEVEEPSEFLIHQSLPQQVIKEDVEEDPVNESESPEEIMHESDDSLTEDEDTSEEESDSDPDIIDDEELDHDSTDIDEPPVED